jgi:hypothetical protein
MLAVMAGEVDALRVSDSTLQMTMISRSRVFGRSMIERTTLQAIDFDASIIDGFAIRASTIDGELGAAGAKFAGLRLENVRYGRIYHLADAGATYERGDRFPQKGP